MLARAPVTVCPSAEGICEFPIIVYLLIDERRFDTFDDRRSRSSKTALIGDSQIPAELGQTITGALANIPFPFGIDPSTGEYGYRKAGADAVTPFKSGGLNVITTVTGLAATTVVFLAVPSPSNDYVDQPASGLVQSSSLTLTIKKACRINVYVITYTNGTLGTIQIKGVSYNIAGSRPEPKNSTPIELAAGDTIKFVQTAGVGNNDFSSCITLA